MAVVLDMLMGKIMTLAKAQQQPFIILENPKYAMTKVAPGEKDVNKYVATIGNAACTFDTFDDNTFTEVYASLRSQLEAEGVVQPQSGAV